MEGLRGQHRLGDGTEGSLHRTLVVTACTFSSHTPAKGVLRSRIEAPRHRWHRGLSPEVRRRGSHRQEHQILYHRENRPQQHADNTETKVTL